MQRIDACHKLRRRERLGNIIIRADHQAVDLIHLLAFSGQHDDADGAVFFTDTPANLKAVHTGHHHVEHSHVEMRGIAFKNLDRLLAGGYIDHLIAGALEVYNLKIADDILVLNDKYAFHN